MLSILKFARHGSSSSRGGTLRLGATIGLTLIGGTLAGQVVTWTGGAGTILWANSANWSPSGAPGSGDDVVFDNSSVATLPGTIQLKGNRSANSLAFDTGDAFSLVNGSGSRTLSLSSGNITRSAASSGSQSLAFTTLDLQNASSGNFAINGTGDFTISSVIDDGGNGNAIIKSGNGTLVLSGANTYSGATTVNGGTLRIGADANLGTAPGSATANKLVLDGGTLESSATFTLNANRGVAVNAGGGSVDVNAGTTLTYNGILTGSGTLNKTDTGTLVLGGATTNTHTGNINVTAGTLQIAKTVANTAIGDTATVSVASGANLTFSGGVSETIGALAGGGTVNNSNAAAITITTGGNNTSTDFSGVLQNTGGALSIVKTGTGAQTLSGTTANTYTGTTAINNGTLNLNKTVGVNALGTGVITVGDNVGGASTANLVLLASNQIANAASVVLNSDGRLALNNFSETIDKISGTGLIDLATSGALTVGGANGSSTFGGSITGTGTLVKSGTGTLTFNSTISFGGTLTLSGGTIALSAIGLTVGTLHITGNTVLDFGNSTASTLNATTFLIDAGVTLTINNWVNAVDFFGVQNWAGVTPGTSGATPMNQITFTGNSSNSTHWQSYDNQVTPVPEPATYGAIFAVVSLSLVAWRRRQLLT